ncbi:MAG: hypothetical protein AMJ67_16680 [Betaproteobacteria bacterium SG8_41]|nr:MAG: hypothetical protein AMJ67_16680 [Betaproteobacteria bacterium SG8_41]
MRTDEARSGVIRQAPADAIDTTGVYASLDDLVRLQYRVQGMTFLPKQPVHSILSGRHASRMRGRGLNFEEIRGYLPGDDVRTIDWKVTARTQKTHVRVFTEERDRPALTVVDQRSAMFFGTRRALKSVVAAETAAASAWRILDQGDRPGAVVFDDAGWEVIRPHRSRKTVMRILETIVEKNHALNADSATPSNPTMLNRVLETVNQRTGHDHLITIISDFDGVDEESDRLLTRLARHNDVLAVPIYDPSAETGLPGGRLVVSGGELQMEIDTARGSVEQRMRDVVDKRVSRVMSWQDKLGVPVLPLSTERDPLDQVREMLGALPGMRRGGSRR